ncbi:MAG: DEAD/DEAH box helicase family protein [Bacteroidales bacterium]
MNIEKYLILNKYLLSLFGVSEFRELQEKLKDAPSGVDSEGRTYFVNVLRPSFNRLKISEDLLSVDLLLQYDQNIQQYVKRVNYRRDPIVLKYFQYLAVLFTEIVLDNLTNRKHEFLNNLNEFLEVYKNEHDISLIDEILDEDLNKLAFWMATGSGKTLIMHINYHQFFHYKIFSPDNIILITPNEGLSKQHFEELQKSGIPCRLYTGSLNDSLKSDNEVLVIEMTKFVEEKKGGGVTLPVDVFEGKNLVFVDEGHKGRKSEEQKWARLRDKLAKNGFVFEYSATFGQILSEKNEEVLKEYANSIIFDYSYKYFYLDGYGKDFSVLNVKKEGVSDQKFQETMFVANLLSFYEQLLVYKENQHQAKEYNLEKPLWIFVGTTVTGKEEESDVVQIVEFIKKVIQDETWLKEKAESILNGKSGFKDENDEDVFENKFEYLKATSRVDFDDLYRRVFGGKGAFGIYELKNADGEFGLKVGENDYFGVINIGNISDFKKQLEKKDITVSQDVVSGSLFYDIKRETSKINILIGSKKFIEGWDTWRVSSMGLLNIGKGQGPQIIQLFGRGVRLKGKKMTLKRSEEKGHIRLLETLNIYGIKADYLDKFLEAIRKEEVEFEVIEIPVKPQHNEKWASLYTLKKDEVKRFEEERLLKLEIDDKIYFTVDLVPRLSMYLGKERSITTAQVTGDIQQERFPEDLIDLLNWERIWEEICEFKITKGYWNLVFKKVALRNLLLSDRYKILTLPEIFEVKIQRDVTRVKDIAILVIKKYIDLFYRKYEKQFDTENLRYDTVGKQLPLFVFEKHKDKYSYSVQIDKRKYELIQEIRKLANDFNKLINEDDKTLPRIYFDNHLYVPILLQTEKIDKISPPGLVESEKNFIRGLKQYLKENRTNFSGVEIYLLRNHPKSGVGFQLQWSAFYPDFIMWIKKEGKQIIVFIDPHGLEHAKGLDDEKIKSHDDIKEINKKLGGDDITLESFILSITPYNKLIEGRTSPPSKDEYIEEHVLFLEDKDWPERLFSNLEFTNGEGV